MDFDTPWIKLYFPKKHDYTRQKEFFNTAESGSMMTSVMVDDSFLQTTADYLFIIIYSRDP
jgi:hypothetical protein